MVLVGCRLLEEPMLDEGIIVAYSVRVHDVLFSAAVGGGEDVLLCGICADGSRTALTEYIHKILKN